MEGTLECPSRTRLSRSIYSNSSRYPLLAASHPARTIRGTGRPGRPVVLQANPRTAYAPLTDDCLTGRGAWGMTRAIEDNAVTVRERDAMTQERVAMNAVADYLAVRLKGS